MANKNAAANLTYDARSRGGSNSSGNFKNDPERARLAGRKGGRASRGGGRRKMEEEHEWEELYN